MFSIKSVELTNFRSFVGTHKWVFPGAAGLYQLTGNNLDNPKLGRNGVGKSSLLDAILWCLYGKTSRGLRASEVVARGVANGTCGCMVSLMVRGELLVIERTQSPNSLILNGDTVDQETLTKALGRNYEAFCYSGILPQGREMFFELSPANKLTLFSEIMGLDEWLELSQKALVQQKQLEVEQENISKQMNLLLGAIRSTEQVIADLKVKSSEWFNLRTEEIELLESRKESAVKEAKLREVDAVRVDNCLPDLKKNIDIKKATLKKLDSEISEVNETLHGLDRELVIVSQDTKACNKAVEQLTQVGPVCPVCAQKVDAIHMEKHISKLKEKLRKYLVEHEELLELRTFADKEHLKLYEDHNHFTHEVQVDLKQIDKLEHHKMMTLSEIGHLEREIKGIDTQIAKLKSASNTFDEMLKTKQAKLIAYKGEYNKLEAGVGSLNEQITAVAYWVNGFKRIRLLVIEETLQALELEVNNTLAQLGLTDWRIEFDVERENKSGGVTKGFSVLIYDPKYDYPIKWESFSAGETQLLKLAGSLGLANLICERAGLVNMVEFFDEASSHLSTEPINALCEVLNERAINSGRQVWVIDHSAIDYGEFAGVLTVVKDINGSRLE